MKTTPKFLVSNDVAFCRIPHPNCCTGRSLPERLEKLGFTSLGWDEHKRIYLPATEKFPEAPFIMEERVSPCCKRERIALTGERLTRYDGRKQARPFDNEIDDFTREFLLEQARARIECKMLPSMSIFSSTWHGTDALPVTVVCESVSGPRNVNGSYIVLEPWKSGSARQVDARIRQFLPKLVSGEMAHELVWTLEDLLESSFPDFPWHRGYTRKLCVKPR